jgi:hypothetical protein
VSECVEPQGFSENDEVLIIPSRSIYFEWLPAGKSLGYSPGLVIYMLLCDRDLAEAVW